MELKSAVPNNSTKAEYSIAKFRSHGALNQAVRHGLSAKIRFAKANMKLESVHIKIASKIMAKEIIARKIISSLS